MTLLEPFLNQTRYLHPRATSYRMIPDARFTLGPATDRFWRHHAAKRRMTTARDQSERGTRETQPQTH